MRLPSLLHLARIGEEGIEEDLPRETGGHRVDLEVGWRAATVEGGIARGAHI